MLLPAPDCTAVKEADTVCTTDTDAGAAAEALEENVDDDEAEGATGEADSAIEGVLLPQAEGVAAHE